VGSGPDATLRSAYSAEGYDTALLKLRSAEQRGWKLSALRSYAERARYGAREVRNTETEQQVGNLPYALGARSFAALRMTEGAGFGAPALV